MSNPKPSSWPCVNRTAASITTSKLASSLPWQASSTTSYSAWSWQASSLYISARGIDSTCTVDALPQALKLVAGPLLATWLLGPTAQNLCATSMVFHGASTCLGTKSAVEEPYPTSASLSASSLSTSIGSTVAWLATTAWSTMSFHSYHICATSQPENIVQVRSFSWSTLVIHSPGITSPIYQCQPYPPQFRHLQFSTPFEYNSKLGVAGCRIIDTGWVYILVSTCRQVRERVSYTAGAKDRTASRAHPKKELSGCLKSKNRAGTCKEQDGNSSGWVLSMDAQMRRA